MTGNRCYKLTPRLRPARLISMAGLLLLLHALALLTLGTKAPGPLLSNLIQLGFGPLAIVAVYMAGQRSGPFGRQVWLLRS